MFERDDHSKDGYTEMGENPAEGAPEQPRQAQENGEAPLSEDMAAGRPEDMAAGRQDAQIQGQNFVMGGSTGSTGDGDWGSGSRQNGSFQSTGAGYDQNGSGQAVFQAGSTAQEEGQQNNAGQNTGWQSGSRQQNTSWQNQPFQNQTFQNGAAPGGNAGNGAWQNGSGWGNPWQNRDGNGNGQDTAGQNTAGQNAAGNGSGRGSFSGYGSYQSFQGNYQYGNGNGMSMDGHQPGKKPKEKKARKPMSPFWKKALAVSVSGICFGVLAGLSFLAVSSLGGGTETTVSRSTQPAENQTGAEGSGGIKSTVTQGTTSAVVTDVTEVVEATMPSIVSITNQSIASYSGFLGQTIEQEQESAGSGIIIGENEKELLVVTNNHVVEGSDKLYVKFIDNAMVEAYIKGTSPSMDLAVIAIKLDDVENDTKEQISVATMGDSDTLKVGEPVIAIGNALGYGQSVTTGVVSALNRTLEVSEEGTSNALIQTDAAINPGNSGGALLDIKGQVIGINSNKIGGSVVEGMGYAIPISSARPIIEELMNQETRERVDEADRGYLGISCINVNQAMSEAYGMPVGVYVAQVYSGTGADDAGLLKGDIITAFGGKTVTNQDDLTSSMQYYAVGDEAEVTIMRGNPTEGYEEQKVSVRLVSQESMNAQ